MGIVFGPATALMSRLRFPMRFALITFLFLLPLGYALWAFISTINYQINFSQKEAWGNEYLRPAHQLYRDMNYDYLYSQVALSTNRSTTEALQTNQSKIDDDFQKLATVDGKFGPDFGTTEKLNNLKAAWDNMKGMPQTEERQSQYATMLSGIRNLISVVGDKSNLILDPDLDSYYTMDAILLQLPAMQNTLVDLSVQVHRVLSARQISSAQRIGMTLLEGQILKLDDNITNGAETGFNNNPAGNLRPTVEGPLNSSREALNTFLSKLDLNVLQAPSITLSPDSWLEQTVATLNASYAQWDVQIAELDKLLATRVSAFEANRTVALGVSLAALLLVFYMWVGFYRAVMKSVANLEKTANMLASGNVTGAINLGARDEMSQRAAAAMAKMATATSQMNSAIEERTNELTEVSYLLAYMHDGVIITDSEGTIKVLNGTATRMLGTDYDTAEGQSLYAFLRDQRLMETMRMADSAPTQRFAVDVPLNNRLILVTVTFVPVEDSKSGLLVMQDVTELRTLQQQQQFTKASLVR